MTAGRVAGAVLLVAVLAGCAARAPGRTQAPPPLELRSAAELRLPAGCVPVAAAVVRVDYRIDGTGRVHEPRASGAVDCLVGPLEQWVASFRYAAPGEDTPATLEWLPVRP